MSGTGGYGWGPDPDHATRRRSETPEVDTAEHRLGYDEVVDERETTAEQYRAFLLLMQE